MGIVLWRGSAYAEPTSIEWKSVAGSFTLDSNGLSGSLAVQFGRDGVDTLRDNPTTSEHVSGSSHGMRNEMYIQLRWLHKTVKCSRFFLVKAEIFLNLMETGE